MKFFKISLLYSLLFITNIIHTMDQREIEKKAHIMKEKATIARSADFVENNYAVLMLLQYPGAKEIIARIDSLSMIQYRARDTYNYPKYRSEAYDAWFQLDQDGIKNHIPYTRKPTQAEMEIQFEKAVNDFEDYWDAEFVRFGSRSYRK